MSMMTDCYFECVYTDTKETKLELYRHLLGRKLRIWIILSFVLSAYCLLAWVLSGKTRDLILTFFYLALALWYLLQPRLQANKAHRLDMKQYQGQEPPCTVRFGQEIVYQDGQIRLVIPYEHVQKVTVLKTTIALQNITNQVIQFPNSGFTGGSTAELMAFLKEKCPQLKLPDWKW